MAFPDFFAEVPTLTLHDGLAQLLGGNIGVDSQVGKGSTFTLRLPLSSENCN